MARKRRTSRHAIDPCVRSDGLTSVGGDPERFAGTPSDVNRLSGSFRIRHTLAEIGAARPWHLLKNEPFVNTPGAMTGNQAVQQVRAVLEGDLLVRLAGGRRRG
jgi:isocitrate lyase